MQALNLRAQEGDTDAFGTVYDHFFLPVYRYTSFRAPKEIVEDLVSDIFVKAWEKLSTVTRSATALCSASIRAR